MILWLYGLPSAGKSTLAGLLAQSMADMMLRPVVLDGDIWRSVIGNQDFSFGGRERNLSQAARLARVIADQGHPVVCAFITPYRSHRRMIRKILKDRVVFIHCHCEKETCQERDPKGMWAKAQAGEISHFTGWDDPFEETGADITIYTGHGDPLRSLDDLTAYLYAKDQTRYLVN